MYQVKCDEYILYDHRDPDLIIENPEVTVEVNTVGSGSFTIRKKHPFFDKMTPKSIFEVSDEYGVVFRGRMTGNIIDFNIAKAIDLEGLMAFFNDSIVRPFKFPEDFLENAEYIAAAESGNVVEFFLKWLIDNHNSQVQDFQKFKLGNVTVSDPNNYITRSSEKHDKTWNVLKSKLFESSHSGYLCIRYEEDGNYIDYLADFELYNTQDIEFGQNLLDLQSETDFTETYSAIIPIGAEIETEVEGVDENGEATTTTVKSTVTLESLPDGNITEDIVKQGDMLYSISAVAEYGWRCAPVEDTTWDDVTEVENLKTKSVAYLTGAAMVSNTREVTACDLHFTDAEIRSFRIYRKQRATSKPHSWEGTYNLTKLSIPLLKPQDTKITVGSSIRSMTDINNQHQTDNIERIESAEKDIAENRTQVSQVHNAVLAQYTQIINDCTEIAMKAVQDYKETNGLEELRSYLETEFKVWAEGISGRVTAAETEIEDVNEDLQERFNEITKWFTFDINGLTIGQVDNPYKIVIDNDHLGMFIGELEVLWLDIKTGEVYTPNLTVKNRFKAIGYLIEEDDDGNVNCDYVGGDA